MDNSYLNPRQKSILEALHKKKHWLKGSEIASEIGVTTRTIRKDISDINSVYKDEVLIESSKKMGYRIANHEIVRRILKVDKRDIPIYPEERINYILKKFLFEKNEIDVYDLADEMLVSTSTIDNDLKRIKEIINDNNRKLRILKKSNNLYLDGSEKDKRALLSELLFNETNNSFLNILNYAKYFDDFDLNIIDKIFKLVTDKYDFAINEMGVISVILHIAITIQRVQNNNYIGKIYKREDVVGTIEYKISKDIFKELESILNISFPQQEVLYITYLILGKKILKNTYGDRNELEKIIEPFFTDITQTLINSINREFGIDFCEDDDLFIGLSLHIKTMYHRIKNNIILRNFILDDLKIRYPFVFEISVFLANEFYKKTKLKMNENEIGFIAVHLGAAFERLRERKQVKKKAALVCTKEYVNLDILLSKINSIYGDRMEIVGVFSFLEIDKIEEKQADIVLTTIQIEHELSIPILKISMFLDERDMKRINKHLNFFQDMMKINKLKFEIDKYFKEDLFYINLSFKNEFDVISFMANDLYKKKYVPENYEKLVIEREKLSSTSFGNYVAIPHSIAMNAYESVISVGVLDKPIIWGNYKVQLVFMFSIKEGERKSLNNLYNYFIEIIDNKEAIKILINSKDFNDFKSKFLTLPYEDI